MIGEVRFLEGGNPDERKIAIERLARALKPHELGELIEALDFDPAWSTFISAKQRRMIDKGGVIRTTNDPCPECGCRTYDTYCITSCTYPRGFPEHPDGGEAYAFAECVNCHLEVAYVPN